MLPSDCLRCPCEDPHQRVKFPFRRHGASDHPPEHDHRPSLQVGRVVCRVEQIAEGVVQVFLLSMRGFTRMPFGLGCEQFVEDDRGRVRNVEDRIFLGGGDGYERIALGQLF